ncbi:DUF3850 domain-containing protein [Leuconostoc gasicomitatum]|uniref:DUF3850 domain-containing protein n=1 Tax=Leuconostoc gasicomitatum TaxID=115778 RepID=UPI001CC40DDB|nr:DUF3850 domain-containing protein [Leuconostoc gasicomitatum]MBZ5980054.1 DUF3850 domain-containing protein [Leuconostoc gasicomitatum]
MRIQDLKLDTKYFDDVNSGLKTFEIRKNDRDYQVGDVLALTAFEYGHYAKNRGVGPKSGPKIYDRATLQEAPTIFFDVTFISEYAQKDGFVVMSIVPSIQMYLQIGR